MSKEGAAVLKQPDTDGLEALEAQVEALALRRAEKRGELEKVRRRRELEERIKLSELEEEHGLVGVDIAAVFCPKSGSMVVVKRPLQVTFQKHIEKQLKDKLQMADVWAIVNACRVYPSREAVQALAETTPGIVTAACEQAISLAKAKEDETAGK